MMRDCGLRKMDALLDVPLEEVSITFQKATEVVGGVRATFDFKANKQG